MPKLPSNEKAMAIDNSGHLISPNNTHTLATTESSLSFFGARHKLIYNNLIKQHGAG